MGDSSSRSTSNWVAGGVALLVLGALDAAIQVVFLVAPHPFSGIGVVAFAFLPVILVYYAVLAGGIVAGIPLAIACIWFGGWARIALGAALLALTFANVASVTAFFIRERDASRAEEIRDAASRDAATKCAAATAVSIQEAVKYFDEPRKIVAMTGPYAVGFENGLRIELPPIDPPQTLRDFFYDRLLGSHVRVAIRPPSVGEMTARCLGGGTLDAALLARPYAGDVYLLDRKIDAAAYVDRAFPRPLRPDGAREGPVTSISRWFDAASGDRTYAVTGMRPVAGYVREGQPMVVRVSPGADSLGLYLCNSPLRRPDSPEHFLSIDAACEGQEKVSLLGYVSPIRDERTPRALLRCLGTVQSPLRTGPRHLITTEVEECRNRSIEMVLGYVE